MSSEPRGTQDLAVILSRILRAGVAIAAAFVLVGTGLYLRARRGSLADFGVFHAIPGNLRGAVGIMRSALERRPTAIIEVGLLILIATPVVRVAVAAVAFLREGDRLYSVIAFTVLSGLLFSLLGPSL